MIRSALKRVVPMVLAVLVVLSLPLTAAAEANFDLNKTGTIRVTLKDVYFPENSVNGTLELFQVGSAQVVNSALTYVLTPDFAGSGVSLADPNAAGLAQRLADYAVQNSITGQSGSSDAAGTVTFSNLPVGLYLVMQREATEGYLPVAPFLVSVPMYSAGNGGWLYTIDASPKLQRPPKEPVSLTVVKKWLDNDKGRPQSLTINLLREGELYETAELNAENSWKYVWTDLDAYYRWSVEEAEVPAGYTVSYASNDTSVTITNKADWYVAPPDPSDLIQTGQLNWPLPVLVSAGLLLIVFGAFLLLRQRKRNA